MNARIVNLRTRRKQKARDEKRMAPARGPAPGISLATRERAEAERRLQHDRLEGHRLDGDPRAGDRPDDRRPGDAE